ncbi:hypothetical protein DIE14_02360 [Burkholderia sp. Bp9017]|uniref:hypothetical protein n=1 Tax=unclassified Burkholderia TaxID=2613784 RepID=UPI000F5E6160|nr:MULTISPECIES: hypothetical protein [unclassified Burkholderia]RQZ31768.1 hypothetical protein DIE14_02360 [Burkholderia sp. Bp9017]RQZ37900.1 hypothetical protein DIE13_02350 [Burkholderia sp. Bp9016]
MKKHIFGRELARKYRIPVATADALLDDVRDHILKELCADGIFVWRGLGTLRVRAITANGRKVRDPHGRIREYPNAVRGSFMLTQAKAARQLFEMNQNACGNDNETPDSADD